MENATAPAPLDKALGNFMARTAKSTVAVIIPLFGYWNDIPENPVDGEVLDLVMRRIYSNVHHLYLIFVANPQTIQNEVGNPKSVSNILIKYAQGGNVKNIPVKRDATYVQYIREGLEVALNETNAQFITIVNPWIMIQEGSFDVLVDRANWSDTAKVISGYNVRPLTEPESFAQFNTTAPKEEYDIDLNFLAMPRHAADMLEIDPHFRTHYFLRRDIFQRMFSKGFDAITSQRVPIFPFDFPWVEYESKEDFEFDRQHFISKWKFDPGMKYENES